MKDFQEKEAGISLAELYARRAARVRARRVGLAYRPALLQSPETPIEVFLAAEEVLAAKNGGKKWGDFAEGADGPYRHHGGWDSRNHYGPSAGRVAEMFASAGGINYKFRSMVSNNWLLRPEVAASLSDREAGNVCRVAAWLRDRGFGTSRLMQLCAVTALITPSHRKRW